MMAAERLTRAARSSITVGRQSELRLIDEALTAARNRRGTTIFLSGEAGIGKSRLATEAQQRARSAGMAVLNGRASTLGPAVPYRPVVEAVLSYRPADPRTPGDQGPDPYRLALEHLDLPGRETYDRAYPLMVAESVLRLIITASRKSGCLVLLEDLHDADAETLAVVEYLVDHIGVHQVVLLITARAETGPALAMARSAQRRRACQLLELSRLTAPQVRQLIGYCLGVPPEAVPDPVTARVCRDGDGNPFVVEELLAGLIDAGVLAHRDGTWRVVGGMASDLPRTVVDSVNQRAERLGQAGHLMLQVAALFGRRFPLSAVQAVSGDHDVIEHLQSAVAADLITDDDPDPDWYAFRHALTADALLASMVAAQRARLANRVADGLEARWPDLPGEWCELVGRLRQLAGRPSAAAARYAEAGRRALAAGAASSAVRLLERAHSLADQAPAARGAILVSLVHALTAAGHLTRAAEYMSMLDALGATPVADRAGLLTTLAWAAAMSGRWAEGQAWVTTARRLLPADAGPEQTAPIDAVAASLAMSAQEQGWQEEAELLARRAVRTALSVPLPVTACQALEVLAVAARTDDLRESDVHFERILSIANEHQLPSWRIRALAKLGGNDFMRHGGTSRLERARREALECGALRDAYSASAVLALAAVLGGHYPQAAAIITECEPGIQRLQLDDLAQYLTMTQAVAAAHQGRRQEMNDHVADLQRWGSEAGPLVVLTTGLGAAFCSLLEEDRARAHADLDQVLDLERTSPTIYGLSGTCGLRVLLGALDSTLGWPEYDESKAAGRANLQWNQQFAAAAHAVLLGRDGQADDAATAMSEALRAAEPFPRARHLILRLVAEAAAADGWGDPTGWARTAEEHFGRARLPAAVAACRSLLRSTGATVLQHRHGWAQVPAHLRRRGVTVREYDVFLLLAEWLSNGEIGERLFISPRTVEKHVAGLLTKTGHPNRAALCRFAARTTSDPGLTDAPGPAQTD
jgi:DNA-binding CsgD family transcriptional regulator/tetratricopeptide (TPR) repeat protein